MMDELKVYDSPYISDLLICDYCVGGLVLDVEWYFAPLAERRRLSCIPWHGHSAMIQL